MSTTMDGITYTLNGSVASVTSFTSDIFANSTIQSSVIINSVEYSVTSIGGGALQSCVGLTSINIPSSITSIFNFAFFNCTNLSSINIPSSGITTILSGAFYNCTNLSSIDIPSSVTNIGSSAFYNCNNLASSITIPSGVTIINENTFKGCSKIPSIFMLGNVTNIRDYAFQDCIGITYINIPSSVTTIGNYAFNNCIKLTSISIPSGIIRIRNNTFHNCLGLNSISLPNSILEINTNAFYNCSALTSITIPGSVTSIGSGAFNNCTQLTSVVIADPISITTISTNSFTDVSNNPSSTIAFFKTDSSANLSSTWQTIANYYDTQTYNTQPLCYHKDTLILILENDEEMYKKISELHVGDMVKTYKSGHKKIKLINSFKYKCLNKQNPLCNLYKMKGHDIIVTGGHSILVDELTKEEEMKHQQFKFKYNIEDKHLLLSCFSDKFEKLETVEEYELFHFVLENENIYKNYGVYINDSVLSESCPEHLFFQI